MLYHFFLKCIAPKKQAGFQPIVGPAGSYHSCRLPRPHQAPCGYETGNCCC